jgi:hypothetical protein
MIILPFRLLKALLSVCFGVQHKLRATIFAFIALFGFWEVFDAVVKQPVTALFEAKSKEYQAEWNALRNVQTGSWFGDDTLYCNYRAAKFVMRAEFSAVKAGLTDDGTRLAGESGFDYFLRRMSRSLGRETEIANGYSLATISAIYDHKAPGYSEKKFVYPEQYELEALAAKGRRAAAAAHQRELAVERAERKREAESQRQGQIKIADGQKLNRETAQRGWWADAATGLMWMARDNGADLIWGEASAYCRNLNAYGYRDWRLPEIRELEGIYTSDSAFNGVYYNNGLKGGIKRDGLEWSSTKTEDGSKALYFNAAARSEGTQQLGRPGIFENSQLSRALCVRGNSAPLKITRDAGGHPISPVNPDGFDAPVLVNDRGLMTFYPVSQDEKRQIMARSGYKAEEQSGMPLTPRTEIRRVMSAYRDSFSAPLVDGGTAWLVMANDKPGLIRVEEYRDNTHAKQ